MKNRWNYIIFPKKFEELYGEGEKHKDADGTVNRVILEDVTDAEEE